MSLLERITFWYPDLLASQRNGGPVYAHLFCLPDKFGIFTWTKLFATPNFLSFVHCFIVETIITHLSTILRWRIWAISCLIPSSVTTFAWTVSHKCKITPTTIHYTKKMKKVKKSILSLSGNMSTLNPISIGVFWRVFFIYQRIYVTVHFRWFWTFHKVCEGHTCIYDESLGNGGVWGIGEGVFFEFSFYNFSIFACLKAI